MRNPQLATDLINYIRRNLLKIVAFPPHQQTTEHLWKFRSHLHAIHHFSQQVEADVTFVESIDNLLITGANYWKLISDNQSAVTNLKAYTKVRTLSA